MVCYVVIILIMILLFVFFIYHFISIKHSYVLRAGEWMLYAVAIAEKEFGSGTGKLKLRYVYDLFLVKFPWLARVITFEMFSELVDKALEEMRHMLEQNDRVAEFVNG